MLDKLIVSVYPTKKPKDIELVSLLDKGDKKSIPDLRKALAGIDLKNKLILITDSTLAKLFKSDYGFNDHGIYFDLVEDFRITNEELERQYKKEHNLYVSKPLPSEHEISFNLYRKNYIERCKLNSVVVFMEKETAKRDYERFMNYENFVDPINQYSVSTNLDLYFTLHDDCKEFIIDIETTGLDFTKDNLTMLSVKAVGSKELLVLENPDVASVKRILEVLENHVIIGHNLVFDLSWLMFYSSLNKALDWQTIDTMLLAHVSGERRLSLKHLSMMYGNFKGRRNTLTADEAYLVEDMLTTELLYNKFSSVYNCFAGRLVCEAVKAFSEVKVRGCYIDSKVLFELRDDYSHLETEEKYNFNINSNRELADYFIKNGVELNHKTATGDYKVDKITLSYLAPKYEIVQEYLDYKAELSIYQKYIKPYCELQSFVLRPDILLFGTETGRLSAQNPNVQQIPNKSKFKDIFRSRFENGYIATIDLDRAELGIAALLSGDEDYVKALLSDDFHRLIASMTFEKPENEITKNERFVAKAVNFGGVLYGGSANGIASRINVESEVVAKVQEWYKQGFPTLTNWIEQQKQLAVRTSQVETFFGRTRILSNMRYDQKMRIGVNTAVQSVASDVMLYIVVRLAGLLRKTDLQSTILFPVHDELLLDIKAAELEQVEKLLQQAFKDVLKTPLGKLSLSDKLPISGTLEYAKSWLYLKSDKYQPEGELYVSSLGDKDETS